MKSLETTSLLLYSGMAFVLGFFAAALFIRWLVTLDRRTYDDRDFPDEYYPEMRRALHYIRQEILGVLGALIVVAAFLAAITVVLLFRR